MPAEVHYSYPVLTTKQAALLEILNKAPHGSTTMGRLSRDSGLPIQNIYTTVQKLILEGFVEMDGEGLNPLHYYQITDKGTRALRAHRAAVKAYERG